MLLKLIWINQITFYSLEEKEKRKKEKQSVLKDLAFSPF